MYKSSSSEKKISFAPNLKKEPTSRKDASCPTNALFAFCEKNKTDSHSSKFTPTPQGISVAEMVRRSTCEKNGVACHI